MIAGRVSSHPGSSEAVKPNQVGWFTLKRGEEASLSPSITRSMFLCTCRLLPTAVSAKPVTNRWLPLAPKPERRAGLFHPGTLAWRMQIAIRLAPEKGDGLGAVGGGRDKGRRERQGDDICRKVAIGKRMVSGRHGTTEPGSKAKCRMGRLVGRWAN